MARSCWREDDSTSIKRTESCQGRQVRLWTRQDAAGNPHGGCMDGWLWPSWWEVRDYVGPVDRRRDRVGAWMLVEVLKAIVRQSLEWTEKEWSKVCPPSGRE